MNHTPRLNLPLMHSAQGQKEITHNEALLIIDALLDPVVQGLTLNNPTEIQEEIPLGTLYIVGNNPQGDFAEHPHFIAQKISELPNGWRFLKPIKWMQVTYNQDGNKYYFNGVKWKKAKGNLQQTIQENIQEMPQQNVIQKPPELLLEKEGGEYLKILHLRQEFTLLGPHVNTTIQIPKASIVIAVNSRVINALSGCTSFSVGVQEDAARYGQNLNPGKDTTNVGLTHSMQAYWYDTPIKVTANGGNFTGGTLLVTIQCFKPHGPWDWE